MFEGQTFEAIMQRALDRVSSEYDKREGSVIYDALAPTCAELAQLYVALEYVIDEAFGDTASREYLIRICAEHGLAPNEATHTIGKAEFNLSTIPIGTRFNINGYVYEAADKISDGVYKVICETAGRAPSEVQGDMLAIDYVDGLEYARLIEITTPGIDEEDTESLRSRYLASTKYPSSSGNVYHYKQWATEVSGVGDAKVFPLWNGPGTVKVVIVDSEKKPASGLLITETAEHIEEMRPIGANVTVVSGEAKEISISAEVVLASGYRLQDVIDEFKKVVTEYFKSIAFSLSYVSYAKIGTMLLSVGGVLDYSLLKINNTVTNISLNDEEIPVLGNVELAV